VILSNPRGYLYNLQNKFGYRCPPLTCLLPELGVLGIFLKSLPKTMTARKTEHAKITQYIVTIRNFCLSGKKLDNFPEWR